jgi:hypothetical protein
MSRNGRMLKVNYENPYGEHLHRDLWNGGHASGELKFYRREKGAWVLKDHLDGDSGGCEYGEYRE